MLAAESAIRARLAEIPDVPGGVIGMAEFTLDSVAGRRFPAIIVGSQGYRVQTEGSTAVAVLTRWIVVVAVRSVSDPRAGTDARAAASPLADEVMARLLRWIPGEGYGELTPVNPPSPEYSAGVLLFPLAFESRHVIVRKE